MVKILGNNVSVELGNKTVYSILSLKKDESKMITFRNKELDSISVTLKFEDAGSIDSIIEELNVLKEFAKKR